MASNKINEPLYRDLYVLEDETNPSTTGLNTVFPSTTLDQVFDDKNPSKKTLRQIIEDLKQEIITGGRGNIIFPITTINGKTGDVVITKADIGLGMVDNTRDADKPLSAPQRAALMDILANYDFNASEYLTRINDHIMDMKNPHGVTLDQINKDDALMQFVNHYIGLHNFSGENTVHPDIRHSLTILWNLVDNINSSLESRVGNVLNVMEKHYNDELAHINLFDKKEDISNKVLSFSATVDNNHTKYPSTKAVSDFITYRLKEFKKELPDVKNWIDDIIIIGTRNDLPPANEKNWRKVCFINKGNSSHNEVAVCRKNQDGVTFDWDISSFDTFTKFDQKYFLDGDDGLTLIMPAIVKDILDRNGALDTYLDKVLENYYTREEIDNFESVKTLKIIPGTMNGTIRYYINDDLRTISNDIQVTGLKRLAYLEWITENEIWDQAIHSNHIISNSIEHRHLQEQCVDASNMNCKYGHILINSEDPDGTKVNEITLMQLADFLRPLIGGWPDPSVPGGNPWSEALDGRIPKLHLIKPGIEYPYDDYSYYMRFTGTISVIQNMDFKELLTHNINLKNAKLVDAGGTWEYQSDPSEWTILGGSNITGHTFATINMTEDGVYLESISIGHRMNAEYDVWIKYVKPDEIAKLPNIY